MYFDALNGLDQGATKAGSIHSDAIKDALKGAAIDTCRGKLTFRECNNQLDAASYIGKVVDTPDYPFPIFEHKSMVAVKGHEVWIPTCEEVKQLQKKRI
jgi:branched-chain amino acid transport system substrate-binding protein